MIQDYGLIGLILSFVVVIVGWLLSYFKFYVKVKEDLTEIKTTMQYFNPEEWGSLKTKVDGLWNILQADLVKRSIKLGNPRSSSAQPHLSTTIESVVEKFGFKPLQVETYQTSEFHRRLN